MKEANKILASYCRLADDKRLLIIPNDKGEPPLWYPAFAGYEGIYVERDIYDKLKERKNNRPCEICPIKNCILKTREPESKEHL